MRLIISSIEKSLTALSKNSENLENDLLNVYYEYNSLSTLWKDGYSKALFDEVERSKSTVLSVVEEIENLSAAYKYMINAYKDYGNEIEVNSNNFSALKNQYNVVINNLKKIINAYTNLDTSFCPSEARFLNSEKKKLTSSKEEIESLRDKTVSFINLIGDTEAELKSRISKIDITYFQAYSYATTTNLQEATMDTEAFEKSLNKFNLYKNEVAKDASEICKTLNELTTYYEGKNSSLLNTLTNEIIKKLNTIVDVESSDASYLDKHKNVYLKASEKVRKQFEGLGEL